MNNISFPGLGLNFKINPVAIPLPLPSGGIHWYAIIIIGGLALAMVFCMKEAGRLGENPENIYDLVLWGLPVAIIAARIYYVVFDPEKAFLQAWWKIFAIWEGGLAIYGAVIGALLTGYFYCRAKGLNLWRYFDIGAFGFLIGQSIGRWGNFVNGEAYGRATELPWRMVVNGRTAHPAFLYESLWNAVGFLILFFLRKKKPFEGFVFCAYLVWYGLGRLWIEALRTDSLMLGNMRISGAVSVLAICLGVIFYFVLNAKSKKEAL